MIDRPKYVDQIMRYVDTPFVKILTGVRRCGKSTILNLVMERLRDRGDISAEQIVSYRFDSMEYEDLTAKQMYAELKGRLSKRGKTYFFLDEVQEIIGWEKVVNSLASDYDVDLYVTGSNSRMMSSEIATYLTGRYVAFRIFTLSFAEYLTFKEQYAPLEDHRIELANYIRLGGFPATHLRAYGESEVYTIIRDIYNSTIFSDIVKRNQIRKIDQLERVVKYAFQNVGNTFSAKSISDYLKAEHRSLDHETVYSYLEKLEAAYLLHRCPRYDLKGKEILKTQEKFYLADTALRYSVLGYHPDTVAAALGEMWCFWNFAAVDIRFTLANTEMARSTLWRPDRTISSMFKVTQRSKAKKQSGGSTNVCWIFGTITPNMSSEPTNSPGAITKASRPCMLPTSC